MKRKVCLTLSHSVLVDQLVVPSQAGHVLARMIESCIWLS